MAAGEQTNDGFETLAIHAGQEPDPLTGAVVPPIYQVSTYKQDGVGGCAAAAVARARPASSRATSTRGPRTRPAGALEECLAALEGGARALAFASGHGGRGLPAPHRAAARATMC